MKPHLSAINFMTFLLIPETKLAIYTEYIIAHHITEKHLTYIFYFGLILNLFID